MPFFRSGPINNLKELLPIIDILISTITSSCTELLRSLHMGHEVHFLLLRFLNRTM